MAEFQEVMRQWRRFCESHNHCGECEFDEKSICGVSHSTRVPFADIELRIMAWAAENPEPVYPTWADYITMKMLEDIMNRNDTTPQTLGTWMGKTNIPADIAEKLGIEPKEE